MSRLTPALLHALAIPALAALTVAQPLVISKSTVLQADVVDLLHRPHHPR